MVAQSARKTASARGVGAKRLLASAGNPSTIEEAIRLVVKDLLQDVTVAPTDLESLKYRLNIKEFCAEDVPFSGELRRNGKRLKIIYSIHLSEERRRFTIAHEMGHALLEKTGRNCPKSGSDIERLCDMLAAEILMPKDVFLEKIGCDLSIGRLFELKRIFRASLLAVAFRCFEFKGASVFEVENNNIRWGCGLVKKGPFRFLEGGLRLNIEDALLRRAGTMEVYFNDRGETYKGELEWSQMSLDRTLFMLKRSNHAYLF